MLGAKWANLPRLPPLRGILQFNCSGIQHCHSELQDFLQHHQVATVRMSAGVKTKHKHHSSGVHWLCHHQVQLPAMEQGWPRSTSSLTTYPSLSPRDHFLTWGNGRGYYLSIFPFPSSHYASPSSRDSYCDQQLTPKSELWGEIFCVQIYFHLRILNSCMSIYLYPEKSNHPTASSISI